MYCNALVLIFSAVKTQAGVDSGFPRPKGEWQLIIWPNVP